MYVKNELEANIILNEINEIIYNDTLSDVEAIELIFKILDDYKNRHL